MTDVRHTYLHYVIEPLLYARANAIDREQPILKEIRDAPLEFRFRSDTVPLTVECLIKAIEARTMDTGIPEYKIPAESTARSCRATSTRRELVQQKIEAVRVAAVQHDMRQGFVLTQYFYEQLLQFEKDPASLKDTIGEMVYSMDVDQQVHRARQIEFDKAADEDVLERSKPRKLEGMDLAEAKLSGGDIAAASAMAQKALAHPGRHRCVDGRGAHARIYSCPRRHPHRPSGSRPSRTSRRRWLPARNSGCWPGRTFTWAECSIWIASAMRRWPSTSWR